MEKKLDFKLVEFKKALDNFEKALKIKISQYPKDVQDSIESGRIQKFEFCVEQLWKVVKLHLYDVEGIDVRTPKGVIKKLFSLKNIEYKEYETLIQMIDDRNLLSHIYKQEMIKEILDKLADYLKIMNKVLQVIS
jgi:nucleotidyltransferase substrate binding protein (TIGR01987 family)